MFYNYKQDDAGNRKEKIMKKSAFNLALLMLALIILVVLFFIIKTGQNDKKPVDVSSAKSSKSVRLATNLQDKSLIEILNQYAKPDDVIEIRAREIDKLSLITTGTPLLIYGKNDNQIESFNLAKKYGVKIIGHNLEDSKISREELVEKEKEAYELAKKNGLTYVFAPLAIHAEKYGADLAKNADAVVIQLRNYQLQENFAEKVKQMAANIKDSNPSTEVWVQLDVNPRVPGNPNKRQSLQSEEMLQQVKLIENEVDLISIYYSPNDSSVARETFIKLRQ